jgi:hypothetical protein
MNQSKIKLALVLIALMTAFGVGAWAISANRMSQEPVSDNQLIENEPAGRTEITYLASPGITSLEQLKDEASDVLTSQSEYGELVDSIEGHKGGTEGKYWSFYVNGEMAQVGAGSYVQKEGDFIEWKFQKL